MKKVISSRVRDITLQFEVFWCTIKNGSNNKKRRSRDECRGFI